MIEVGEKLKPLVVSTCTLVALSWICAGCGVEISEKSPENGSTGPAALPEPAIAWQPRHYVAYLTESAVEIDGKIDDAVWAGADWSADFVDIEGGSAPAWSGNPWSD